MSEGKKLRYQAGKRGDERAFMSGSGHLLSGGGQ
jgi:hypothetical protein